ncbi:hypothetical protein BSKO_04399 [Bryopsis sp. KO-2023]|nr:hypothetical protein BSKO_04399 [Bryopsis sp. KO-2023]
MSETDSDSSSDTAPRPESPGPVDPEQCNVTGNGFSGGAAGELVSLTIVSKDAMRLRVREGGYNVVVSVNPSGGDAQDCEPVEVVARDNRDGTYSASYSVPSRGNYTLSIAMNGTPIGGSPFPVFFSPPQPGANNAELGGAAQNGEGVSPGALGAAVANLPGGLSVSEATQALGGAIVNAVYVTNISPNVHIEQLKQLFAYCGKVADVHFVGETRETALVEYTTALEARCATGLDGTVVGDRPLRVQLGTDLAGSTTTGGNPYLSLQQVQQLQHVHSSNQHATQLAAQLAGLRAIARTALLPAIQDEEKKNSGKKAALAAAAELSKKLNCLGNVSRGSSPHAKRRRSRSVSRSRRRSRSHSPPRKRRSRSRSRSRSRNREPERRSSLKTRIAARSRRSRSRERRRTLQDRRRRSTPPRDHRSPRRSDPYTKRPRASDRSGDRSRRDAGRRDLRGSRRDRTRSRSRDRSRDRQRDKVKSRDHRRDHRNDTREGSRERRRNESRRHERGKDRSPRRSREAVKSEENTGLDSVEVEKNAQNGDVLEEMRQRALEAFLKKKIPSDVVESDVSQGVAEVKKDGTEVNITLEDDNGDTEENGDGSQVALGICPGSDQSESPLRKELERKRGHREHRKYRRTQRTTESPPHRNNNGRSVSVE